jgi:hypothetical protein
LGCFLSHNLHLQCLSTLMLLLSLSEVHHDDQYFGSKCCFCPLHFSWIWTTAAFLVTVTLSRPHSLQLPAPVENAIEAPEIDCVPVHHIPNVGQSSFSYLITVTYVCPIGWCKIYKWLSRADIILGRANLITPRIMQMRHLNFFFFYTLPVYSL